MSLVKLQEARDQQRAKIRHRVFLRCRQLRITSVLKRGLYLQHLQSRATHDAYLENIKNNANVKELFHMRHVPIDVVRNVHDMLHFTVPKSLSLRYADTLNHNKQKRN